MIKLLQSKPDKTVENLVKECDDTLEKCKGKYQDVLIIGYKAKDGIIDSDINDSFNLRSSLLWIIKKFEKYLLEDTDD